MELRHGTIGVKWMAVGAVFAGLLALAGCKSQERVRPVYLSSESRLVGGGVVIEWKAPQAGTVYLVEKRTDRLIQTFTLQEGEAYRFAVESIVDAQELENMLGIDLAKAQLLLYFKPDGRESSAPQP